MNIFKGLQKESAPPLVSGAPDAPVGNYQNITQTQEFDSMMSYLRKECVNFNNFSIFKTLITDVLNLSDPPMDIDTTHINLPRPI